MLRKRIRDIFSREIIGIPPETSVSEAVGIMVARNISCILILREGRPVGIFTERNLVSFSARGDFDLQGHQIKDCMSSPVLTAGGEMFVYDAFNMLQRKKVRHLVVVNDEGLAIGMVTLSDMIRHVDYNSIKDVQKVSQIMTRTVRTFPPDTPVRQIVQEMDRHSISCIVIARENKPLGIVTERDIGRLLKENSNVRDLAVDEVMTTPVKTTHQDTSIFDAAALMKEKNIRRLIIEDREGKIAGLMTQSDIIMGLEGKYIETLKQIIKEKESVLRYTAKDLAEKTVYLENILRSSIGMGIVATDIDFIVQYFNPTAEEILDHKASEVIGNNARDYHAEFNVDMDRFDAAIEKIRSGLRHGFTFERPAGDGSRLIQSSLSGIRDPKNELVGFVLMLEDITERKKAEDTIQHLAYHDNLTDLPNRLMFMEQIHYRLADCERYGHKMALLVLDLDRLKETNDTHGHTAGDILLKTAATRMKNRLRKSDFIARVGGDEFFIILPHIKEPDEALNVARGIAEALQQPIPIEGGQVFTSASIGIALYPQHGKQVGALIRAADLSMYQAKEKNRQNRTSNIHLTPIEHSAI